MQLRRYVPFALLVALVGAGLVAAPEVANGEDTGGRDCITILLRPSFAARKLEFLAEAADAAHGRDAAWVGAKLLSMGAARGRVTMALPLPLPDSSADMLEVHVFWDDAATGNETELVVLIRPAPVAPADEIMVLLRPAPDAEDDQLRVPMRTRVLIPRLRWLVGMLAAGGEHETAKVLKDWLRTNLVGIEHEDIG